MDGKDEPNAESHQNLTFDNRTAASLAKPSVVFRGLDGKDEPKADNYAWQNCCKIRRGSTRASAISTHHLVHLPLVNDTKLDQRVKDHLQVGLPA